MQYIKFKGLFKELPMWGQFTIVLFLLLFSSLSLLMLGEVLLKLFPTEDNTLSIEITQLFSALGMFIVAPLAIAYLFSYHPQSFLSINKPQPKLLLLAIICIITSIPFINYITSMNELMQLPEFLSGIEEWMRKMEDKNTRLTQEMLANQAWEMILLDILILAIIPAIGEEFLFRGIIQRGIEKKTHNIHLAIWCSAFIFSTIHLQFYGFFPRMFMGAIFGYMLYWGKSIWIPIACHFTNNFLVIITSHLYPEEFETSYLDNIGKENLLIAVISLLIFSFFIFLYKKISTK